MARITTTVTVFFIAMNLFAGMLMAAGVDHTLGLDANIGGDEAVNESVSQAEEVRTGTGLGATLFAMYNVLAEGLSSILTVVFPALNMLERTGVPTYITTLLGTVFTVILAIDFVSFLRGFNL